ncbi:MAG: hypothetical protein ABI579_05430 [Candidatus Sumerlaeota bacterium]
MSLPELIVEGTLLVIVAYLCVGVVVSVYLHTTRLVVIDPAAKDAGFFFRLIITPGLIALWPLMLLRSRRANPPGTEQFLAARQLRTRHRVFIMLLSIVIPVLLAVAILSRSRPALNAVDIPVALQQPAPTAIE